MHSGGASSSTAKSKPIEPGSPKKRNKIEQYVSDARKAIAMQEKLGDASLFVHQSTPLEADPDTHSSGYGGGRIRALETSAVHEVQPRRPIEKPFPRSYDVHFSIANFAPQRKVDIGRWGENVLKVEKQDGWYTTERAVSMRKFLRNHWKWQAVSMSSVFVALFLAEAFAWFQVPGNGELDFILTVVLLLFAGEFIGLTASDPEYPFSVFFWMDLVGTLSMTTDISYLYGADVTSPQRMAMKKGSGGSGNAMLVRAARAARLGARAGRLSRVLKLMKYLPVLLGREEEEEETKKKEVKMATIISNQINDTLATRVAFLVICIAVTLPAFAMFNYPQRDDSLGAWAEGLALDAYDYDQAARNYDLHKGAENRSLVDQAKQILVGELKRCAEFYQTNTYGPFDACLGNMVDGIFICDSKGAENTLPLEIPADQRHFQAPARASSIWLMSEGRVQLAFNLSTPMRMQAAASMGLILVLIVVMVGFALLMSHSVAVIALQPMERMLSTVRDRCHQIFSFIDATQEETEECVTLLDEEEDKDNVVDNEFMLLEKAVSRLAAIADLSNHHQQHHPHLQAPETQDDMLCLNLAGFRADEAEDRSMLKLESRKSRSGSQGVLLIDDTHVDERDKVIEALSGQISGKVFNSLVTWNFDVFVLKKEEASILANYVILSSRGSRDWAQHHVSAHTMEHFITACASKYKPNPFHNWYHAVDVCWAVSRFAKLCDADAMLLSEVGQFWLMVAGIGHDLGHEGVSNQFYIETGNKYALMYNDKSPLENMHCSTLFHILGEPDTALFEKIDKTEYKDMRKGMINAILHTDVTKHFDMVKQLSLLYHTNSEIIDAQGEDFLHLLAQPKNNELIVAMFLHTADVGNPMKPWLLSQFLAALVMQEFFEQGDKEKLAGIPVGVINDRNKVTLPNTQIGFIEFLIAPLVEATVWIFPHLDDLASNLGLNIKQWLVVWKEDTLPTEEEAQFTSARVERVYARMSAIVDMP